MFRTKDNLNDNKTRTSKDNHIPTQIPSDSNRIETKLSEKG